MKETSEDRKLKASETISRVFGIVMVVLYLILGTTIIFKAPEIRDIQVSYARIFGIVLIAYGVYRAYNLYRKHSANSES